MPDLCTGENCPIKLECYRYRAKPIDKQDYALFHYNSVAGKCFYFMEIFKTAKKGDKRLCR
jgi:hypothetical protein